MKVVPAFTGVTGVIGAGEGEGEGEGDGEDSSFLLGVAL